ncbi:hypothetical protein [Nesterenkonia populi]|uniref:hypothetical protein n=1 Tax=Nesterenkonia populi TaxID=1591087 RepID=UPI0011BFD3D2|nr:hypothetical protein [Nesterenkonia populi]
MRRLPHEESGQISILTLGFFALLLLLCAVVLGATAVNLQARQLLAEADGAVSAAVEHQSVAPGRAPQLSDAQIRHRAQEHLELSGAHSRHDNLTVVAAWTGADGQTAHLRLGATAELPLAHRILPARVELVQESHTRLEVDR